MLGQRNLYFSLLLLVAAAGFSGCEKSGPFGTLPPTPGRRDYTWTIDTVYAPYNRFWVLTGTSASDLWAVNPGDGDKTIYHFDGNNWRTDGISRPIVPNSAYSVSPTDVWIGGNDGRLWHYDGVSWSEKYKYVIDDSTHVYFMDICGRSSTDLYAVGGAMKDQYNYQALILHYDGTRWTPVGIPNLHAGFAKIRLDQSGSGKYYLVGFTDELSQWQFYEFDGSNIVKLKEGLAGNEQLGDLLEVTGRVDFIIGHDLYAYSNGSFTKLAHLTDSPQFLNGGCARSEADVFLAMLDGIVHYNGTDTQYLVGFQSYVRLIGMKIFEKDVFFMGWDQNGNNLIFHGKSNT